VANLLDACKMPFNVIEGGEIAVDRILHDIVLPSTINSSEQYQQKSNQMANTNDFAGS